MVCCCVCGFVGFVCWAWFILLFDLIWLFWLVVRLFDCTCLLIVSMIVIAVAGLVFAGVDFLGSLGDWFGLLCLLFCYL